MLKTRAKMFRLAKIGLAIVIVVSVASILITPDPSDDVIGVLQHRHVVKTTVARILPLHAAFVLPIVVKVPAVATKTLAPAAPLDLTCVLLC